MLVDQKFHKGDMTRFFGLEAQTNPLLAKLVRQFECEVYPSPFGQTSRRTPPA
jgi:KDO2-lipid IV(A) lauroyltransferase